MDVLNLLIKKANVDYEAAKSRQYEHNYFTVKDNLRQKIQNKDIHGFGSRPMGISTDKSDLDIFIDTGELEFVFLQNYQYY